MILVTGGTGLVGAHLLLSLVKSNQQIRATYRNKEHLALVKKCFGLYYENPEKLFDAIQWVEADITDIPALTNAFKNVEYVYHCAAIISFNPVDFNMLRKINIEGTANIVNLCLDYKIKKMCYVSSIATLGNSLTSKYITEETHWNNDTKNSIYAITKYGAELEVWRGTQEGLNAIIVNPGVIIGPGFWNRGSGLLFKKASKGLKYYTIGVTGFVSVNDVVLAMVGLMKSSINNERYILVSENITYKKFFGLICNILNKPKPKTKASKLLLSIAWRLDWLKYNIFGIKRQLTKSMAKSALSEDYYSNEKIKTDLNFNFEPLHKCIKATAKYYKEN